MAETKTHWAILDQFWFAVEMRSSGVTAALIGREMIGTMLGDDAAAARRIAGHG
jgi:hypothetical protein